MADQKIIDVSCAPCCGQKCTDCSDCPVLNVSLSLPAPHNGGLTPGTITLGTGCSGQVQVVITGLNVSVYCDAGAFTIEALGETQDDIYIGYELAGIPGACPAKGAYELACIPGYPDIGTVTVTLS